MARWRMSGSRALRRGFATLLEVIVVRQWAILALRGTIFGWGWLVFGTPLALLLWFDLRPYRTGGTEMRLGLAATWLMIFRFVAMVVAMAYGGIEPGFRPRAIQAIILLVALLVAGAVLRCIEIRKPLRVIRAAPGGGFLVYFPPDPALEGELGTLPGAVREGAQWKFPATPESADALLRFARERQFEYKP